MGVGSALMGFFGLVWRILEGIRKVLHLVLLLVIFGFILAALHTSIPMVPRSAALVIALRANWSSSWRATRCAAPSARPPAARRPRLCSEM
jgi:hypothetical protein